MPKTYNSIPTVATGDVYTATAHNNIAENVNNYRVPPLCVVYRNAALNHTSSGSTQTIAWDTQVVDTESDDMWATSPNADRITIRTAGVYLLTTTVAFAFNSTGIRALQIEKNDGTLYGYTELGNPGAWAATVTGVASAAVGDYFVVKAYQNSGGNLAYSVSNQRTAFSATWLGQVS